jgi:phage recombination protein Bet
MTATGTAPGTGSSLIVTMATRYGLEPSKFYSTLEKTILPSGKQASQEQVAAFLVVANHYNLNPFIKEIFAFPSQGGGITPIVSVDGWLTIINRQPSLDGIEYQDHLADDGTLTAITCRIYRKDRSRPNEITEYMKECRKGTSVWTQWPARMLRHKALIQCARQAFGLAGIYDPDEAERIAENEHLNGNGSTLAEKTKAKVEEMKQRYEPPVEDAVDEPDAIDGEVIETDIPDIHTEPADTDEAAEQDELDCIRADLQSALDELPKSRQKDLLAGKSPLSKMTEEELTDFAAALSA